MSLVGLWWDFDRIMVGFERMVLEFDKMLI